MQPLHHNPILDGVSFRGHILPITHNKNKSCLQAKTRPHLSSRSPNSCAGGPGAGHAGGSGGVVGMGFVVEGGPTGGKRLGIKGGSSGVAVPGIEGTGVPGIEWATLKLTGKFGGNGGKLGSRTGNIIVGSGAGGAGGKGGGGGRHRAYAGIRREGHVQLQRLVAHAGYMQYSGRTNHFQSLERNCCWHIN